MSLRATLRDRLLIVWAGDPWHGSNSKKILEDVTATEAAAHPAAGGHSIAEITRHMVAWTEEVTSRVRGNRPGTPHRGDWPAATDDSAAGWTSTTEELRTARHALLDAIEKAHEEDLYGQVGKADDGSDTQPVSRVQTAFGLADHDVYHLGQIALLKKSLRHAL